MLNLTLRYRKVIFSSKTPRIPAGKYASVAQPCIACAVLRHQGQQPDVMETVSVICTAKLLPWTVLNTNITVSRQVVIWKPAHTHTQGAIFTQHTECTWPVTQEQTLIKWHKIWKCWAENAGNVCQSALCKGTGRGTDFPLEGKNSITGERISWLNQYAAYRTSVFWIYKGRAFAPSLCEIGSVVRQIPHQRRGTALNRSRNTDVFWPKAARQFRKFFQQLLKPDLVTGGSAVKLSGLWRQT